MDKAKLERIWNSMNTDEQQILSLGIFPYRLEAEKLDNHEAAELIRMSQTKTGVRY